jgi:FKBP-type peptidyl-prolyl cis-trans isomerase (trigger factor)
MSGFRPGVVALDWEIAVCSTAHRDLVEMLTFVMPPDATRTQIDRLVTEFRMALARLGINTGLDRDTWMEAFRTELKVEAINRVGMQCIFATAFPLAYYARINANIERLLDLYD